MKCRLTVPMCLSLLLCLALCTGSVESQTAPANQAAKPSQAQYVAEIKKHYEQENFAALDELALQARISKERFAGAEWKLYVFYQTLTWPSAGVRATDEEWKVHLNRLQKWVKDASDSMTARVALGGAWIEYAQKARTSNDTWTDFDGHIGGKQYQERLRQAEKALTFDPIKLAGRFANRVKTEFSTTTASQLRSYCPHWYVAKLALEQGHTWDWNRFNNTFSEGVALEPAYYYLYKAKAFNLLPQQHGAKREWELFAEQTARNLGGQEGVITYYLIAAHVSRFFNPTLTESNFFQANQVSWPRLLESYKQLEATYGTSYTRLNEMALLASLAKEHASAKLYFDRIGAQWDVTVWQDKAIFDSFKNLAIAKAAPQKAANWTGGTENAQTTANYTGLKATLSTRTALWHGSDEVVIEAMIENTTRQPVTLNTYQLNHPALALIIQDAAGRKPAFILPPQVSDTRPYNKVLKPGEYLRFTYRLNFLRAPLPAGAYTIKLQAPSSNELSIRITNTRRG